MHGNVNLQGMSWHNHAYTYIHAGELKLNLTSKPALSDLMNKVAPKTPDKWKMIGLQLGVSVNRLNAIEYQRQADTNSIFMEVFTAWEKQPGDKPCTWSTMIDVLRSPAVGEHTLAQTLQESMETENT